MSRCNHQREHPVLTVPVKHRRLSIISKVCDKITDFYNTPTVLPTLNTMRARKLKQLTGNMKSQRREAVIQVLIGLLTYTDLATMRVGFGVADGFKALGVRFFVNLTGLSQSRYERALADINAAGLIVTHRRCKRDDNGNYVGLNAVRCVSKELFEVFGLGKWLAKQRKKCSNKLYEQALERSIANAPGKAANLSMIAKARSVGSKSTKSKKLVPEGTGEPPGTQKMKNPHLRAMIDILKA